MPGSGLLISNFSGVTVVSFRGRSVLDPPAVEAIAKDLYALVDAQAQRKVVLDFSEVRFLTSSMIGVMINLHKKAKAIKGTVVICSLQPNLMEVFKVTKLDSLLEFAKDEADAFKRLGGG